MKHLILAPFLLVVALGACSSRTERAQRERDTAEWNALKSRLRPGLAIAQIREWSPKIGNCTGSPTGAQRCEAQYLIAVARSLPNVTTPQLDASTARYQRVLFDFLRGTLVRWEESEELRRSSW